MSEESPAQPGGFRAGSLLAGYRLEEPVGAGGMAVVFRARDQRLGRLVALKILAAALAADDGFRRRFIAESRAAAAVDDPHIIPVYEAGEAGGVLFIAMRLVLGGDLRRVLAREGPLTPGRAAGFLSPVASALDAAHRAGLVHRDVKPANILVDAHPDRPDHVYLSDFGVSKGASSSVSLTGAGQFLGTPDYSAPEQIQGRAVDGRTDQYALACVAYQLLAGSVPFERDQGMAVLLAHLSEPPPSLGTRRPDLPGAADQVLARGMAKAPEKRYGSCGDFADALREALSLTPYHPRGTASAGTASAGTASAGTASAPYRPRAEIVESPGPDAASPAVDAVPTVTSPGDGRQRATPARGADHPRVAAGGHGIRRRPVIIAAIAVVIAVTGLVIALTTFSGVPSAPGAHGRPSAHGTPGAHAGPSAPTTSVRWTYTGENHVSSLAVAGSAVYVGSNDGSGHGSVYALDAATGQRRWSYGTAGALDNSPAVAGGTVYVGSGGGISGGGGGVYALDAATGQLRWSYMNVNAVDSSPAVAGGTIYVASGDPGGVYALDAATGRLRWSYATRGGLGSGPAVGGGTVYAGGTDGSVYALDAATGRLRWSYAAGGTVDSSAAVAGGTVYAGSTNGKVYALSAG